MLYMYVIQSKILPENLPNEAYFFNLFFTIDLSRSPKENAPFYKKQEEKYTHSHLVNNKSLANSHHLQIANRVENIIDYS